MSTIHACHLNQGESARPLVVKMLEASDYWRPDAITRASNADQSCTLAKAALFNTKGSEQDGVYHDTASGLIISANARLDNRTVLGGQLQLSQTETTTLSDSQLILRAYQRWGQACPEHLLGDFVFIIRDEPRRRFFCARDHFGVKVLFYAHTERGIMLTNEHNAFFTSAWLPKELSEAWLVQRLWGLGPSPFESPYNGIEVLPAAHSLTIDRHGLKLQRYWQLQQSDAWQGMSDDALIDELKQRFERAVERRLDSAYPMGAELSEGLDSNGIVGFGAQLLGTKPLYTLSYRCEPETKQNRDVWHDTYQDIYAMHEMHSNVKAIWKEPDDPVSEDQTTAFFSNFGGILDISGGHFLRSSLAEKHGIHTLLSGWGGDHCVTSYGNFFERELLQQGRLGALHKHLGDKHKRKRGAHPGKAWTALLLKHHVPALHRRLIQSRGGLENAMLERGQNHFLKQEFRDRYRCDAKLKEFVDSYQSGRSVQQYEWRELFDIGVEKRLVESELCGRMARVEYRNPMLDVELVEFAYNIPGHLKIHNGVERYHFRRVLEGVTTERIQWRLKADVDHPNIDFEKKTAERRTELQKALENNTLTHRYCDKRALDTLLQSAPMISLRTLDLLVHLQQQQSVQIV